MPVAISNLQKRTRPDLRRLRTDSSRLLRLLGLQRAELSLVLVSPQRMRAMNRKYRGLDRSTDVLSFPQYQGPSEFPKSGGFPLGDVIINPTRARAQARRFGHTAVEEMRRLLVHGVLHLLGHEHENDPASEALMMKKQEALLLKLSR